MEEILSDMTIEKLQAAISFAAMAHSGQTDKAGAPYIGHPLRVMEQMDTIESKITAVLHDVIEDTPYTARQLQEVLHLPEAIIKALILLTREKDADYMDYIRRLAKNPLAAKVKRADLTDNMDLTRLPSVTDKDRDRCEKYAAALAILDEYDILRQYRPAFPEFTSTAFDK